jgi:NAD(P)-dependent dehydrogenase (short-subunit alcohol dehydrogenase family)
MALRHQNSAIIVTGAAGAIGFATCEILAREGASLLMVDIDGDRLAARAGELAARGHNAIAHVADCADADAVAAYASAAMGAFGKVDGFFNNAGIEGDLAPTHEYDVAMFDRIIRVPALRAAAYGSGGKRRGGQYRQHRIGTRAGRCLRL